MSARAISIEAYKKHIEIGKQASQWMLIFAFMEAREPLTRSEISAFTGIRLSSVCGRVNELIAAGLLTEYDRRECQITHEPAHTVTTSLKVPNTRQFDLF